MRGKTWITGVAVALCLSAGVSTANANAIEVTVLATAGPWNWALGGLNSSFHYGPALQDFTSPTIIDLQADLGIFPGDTLFITYKGGLTNAFGGPPSVNQAGHVGLIFKDDTLGSSGEPMPSLYMPDQWGSNSADAAHDCSTDASQPCQYGVFLEWSRGRSDRHQPRGCW